MGKSSNQELPKNLLQNQIFEVIRAKSSILALKTQDVYNILKIANIPGHYINGLFKARSISIKSAIKILDKHLEPYYYKFIFDISLNPTIQMHILYKLTPEERELSIIMKCRILLLASKDKNLYNVLETAGISADIHKLYLYSNPFSIDFVIKKLTNYIEEKNFKLKKLFETSENNSIDKPLISFETFTERNEEISYPDLIGN